MKRSALGSYAGYSTPVANGYVRHSEYVQVRDGCLLAVDMLHPAIDGVALKGRFPAVVRGTGYRRAFRRGERIAYDVSRIPIIAQYPVGTVITPYELAPVAKRLVDHGYVFVSIDIRGTGASYGTYDQPATIQTGRDLADVIDWLAQQDWSDGKIGMWGRSWEAAVQLMTMVAGTKNLTCACPMAIGGSQMVSSWYEGMFAIGFRWPYNDLRKRMELDEYAMPVDGQGGERARDEAVANRPGYFPWPSPEALGEDYKRGTYASEWLERSLAAGAPIDPALGRPRMAVEDADSINACGAAVYWLDGWWDLNFINSAVSLYTALSVPKKLTIGPWTHSQFALAHEPHRWFDHWLKGIDNGIMAEPDLHYSVSSTDGTTTWHAAARLPDGASTLFLAVPEAADPTRDAVLAQTAPEPAALTCITDYDVSTGPQTRSSYLWKSVQLNYGDMARRVGTCLTFTSAPLTEDLVLTGVPTLRLQVAVSGSPAAIFATLEEVEPDGSSRYLTEGLMNLAYRAELTPTPNHYGSVLHPAFPTDAAPVPIGERMDVTIDMLALGLRLPAGRRLRVTIAGADRENYYLAPQDPPVALTLWTGPAGARITLPVIAPAASPPAVADVFLDDPMPFAFEPYPA